MLTVTGASWYSYEDKQSHPIKVMIKNLHHSCGISALIADLKEQGLNVLNVVN